MLQQQSSQALGGHCGRLGSVDAREYLPTSMTMMKKTTSSSTRVKAGRGFNRFMMDLHVLAELSFLNCQRKIQDKAVAHRDSLSETEEGSSGESKIGG